MADEYLLALAIAAARRGGQVLSSPECRVGSVGVKSSITDLAGPADRAAESAVLEVLRSARPLDGILAEESEAHSSSTDLRWVVDALDGSVNFLRRIPHYAVSVACERRLGEGWHPLVGVVYDVERSELFTARRGLGAHVNGRRLAVNDPVALPAALVATEFSYRAEGRAAQAAPASRVLARAGDLRCTGSSALDLCWVAAGRFDASYEDELGPWDWAAGALIAQEAGGTVTALETGVLAAGPSLHRELSALVGREIQPPLSARPG